MRLSITSKTDQTPMQYSYRASGVSAPHLRADSIRLANLYGGTSKNSFLASCHSSTDARSKSWTSHSSSSNANSTKPPVILSTVEIASYKRGQRFQPKNFQKRRPDMELRPAATPQGSTSAGFQGQDLISMCLALASSAFGTAIFKTPSANLASISSSFTPVGSGRTRRNSP